MVLKKFSYGEDKLTFELSMEILNGSLDCHIGEEALNKINNSRKNIESILKSGDKIYGVNTGLGTLCSTIISNEDSSLLQENLLKSHAVGVGISVPLEISKLMLILKVHSLCKGFSGIRIDVIERICWHIEKDIIPAVPSQGSVGASGDLAPLAHLFLPLIGEGEVLYKGKQISTKRVLDQENKLPLKLKEKEGLALILSLIHISEPTRPY